MTRDGLTGITIRNETARDFSEVERLTREAFWNVHVPGCSEHYLAHILRTHGDFVPELDLVAEAADGTLAGNVMYTTSRLTGDDGGELPALTFGPLSVRLAFQHRGIGRRLVEESLARAAGMGYAAVVIFGNPGYYVSHGFTCCKKFGVRTPDGRYPCALLVKELKAGALGGGRGWTFRESPVYDIDPAAAEKFDASFPPLKKERRPSQEAFFIFSHSVVQ